MHSSCPDESDCALESNRMLENYNHIFYVRPFDIVDASCVKLNMSIQQNDTSLSSVEAVCANIFTNFALTAMRTVNYLRHFATDLDRYGGRIYGKRRDPCRIFSWSHYGIYYRGYG